MGLSLFFAVHKYFLLIRMIGLQSIRFPKYGVCTSQTAITPSSSHFPATRFIMARRQPRREGRPDPVFWCPHLEDGAELSKFPEGWHNMMSLNFSQRKMGLNQAHRIWTILRFYSREPQLSTFLSRTIAIVFWTGGEPCGGRPHVHLEYRCRAICAISYHGSGGAWKMSERAPL